MPGTMLRPRNEVNVVHQPVGVVPNVMPGKQRDQIVFSKEDRKYFHIEKVLGAGGFGVAAKVRVLKTGPKFYKGEIIVVKQLRTQKLAHIKRFREEYNIARVLGVHENIVEMFAMAIDCHDGSGSTCDRLFMRYCNAGTLFALIQDHKKARKPLPEGFIWYVLASMGFALARMHNGLNREDFTRTKNWTGYVHYDIKPDNILLNWSSNAARKNNPYPTPKLGDYGCAGRIGRKPDIVGHVFYRSPELVENAFRPCLPEADIFSLGMSIYEMCEFTFPYPMTRTRNGEECLDFKRYRPMKSGYHSRLKRIVDGCLHPDYRKRPNAEEIFLMCRQFKDDTARNGWLPWGSSKLQIIKPKNL